MKFDEKKVTERIIRFREEADNLKEIVERVDELFQKMEEDRGFEYDPITTDYCMAYNKMRPDFMRVENMLREIAECYEASMRIIKEMEIKEEDLKQRMFY